MPSVLIQSRKVAPRLATLLISQPPVSTKRRISTKSCSSSQMVKTTESGQLKRRKRQPTTKGYASTVLASVCPIKGHPFRSVSQMANSKGTSTIGMAAYRDEARRCAAAGNCPTDKWKLLSSYAGRSRNRSFVCRTRCDRKARNRGTTVYTVCGSVSVFLGVCTTVFWCGSFCCQKPAPISLRYFVIALMM